jgi:hypothetical protein
LLVYEYGATFFYNCDEVVLLQLEILSFEASMLRSLPARWISISAVRAFPVVFWLTFLCWIIVPADIEWSVLPRENRKSRGVVYFVPGTSSTVTVCGIWSLVTRLELEKVALA